MRYGRMAISLKEYPYPLRDTTEQIRLMPISTDDQDALISVLETGELPARDRCTSRHLSLQLYLASKCDLKVPASRRPSAYGLFTGVYGLSWFLGSVVMGILYDHSVPAVIAFYVIVELTAIPLLVKVRTQAAFASSSLESLFGQTTEKTGAC